MDCALSSADSQVGGFVGTLLWDWGFLQPSQSPLDFTARGFESLVFLVSHPTPGPCGPPRCCRSSLPSCLSGPGCPSLLFLPVWMNVSLTPWLSEFHANCYSGGSVGSLFLNWLLSFFWLHKEAKCFYLHLHRGWNPLVSVYWWFLVCVLSRDQTCKLDLSRWCSDQLRYQARPYTSFQNSILTNYSICICPLSHHFSSIFTVCVHSEIKSSFACLWTSRSFITHIHAHIPILMKIAGVHSFSLLWVHLLHEWTHCSSPIPLMMNTWIAPILFYDQFSHTYCATCLLVNVSNSISAAET